MGILISTYEDTGHIGLEPIHITSFNLITSLEASSPNTVSLCVCGGGGAVVALRASTYGFKGKQFSPQQMGTNFIFTQGHPH